MNKLLWLVVTLIILTQFFGGGVMTQRKHDQMLFTVVTVDGVGSGSGVVVHSKDNLTLILTAKHVVKKMDEVDITFHPDGQEYHAIVVRVSKKRDLALLAVEGYTHPYVATLSTDLNPRVYSEVWKVGGGMSLVPHPGVGMITGLPKNHIMHDAGTIFGDSGGGLFIKDELGHFHLTGIIVSVGMVGPQSPLPHIGFAHDIETIIRFLESV